MTAIVFSAERRSNGRERRLKWNQEWCKFNENREVFEKPEHLGTRLLPSRSMGLPGILPDRISFLFRSKSEGGSPHERLASNICKQACHRPMRTICFNFFPLELD